jgi:hypothetical protein
MALAEVIANYYTESLLCVNRFAAKWDVDLIHLFTNLIILFGWIAGRMIRSISVSLLAWSALYPTLNSQLER